MQVELIELEEDNANEFNKKMECALEQPNQLALILSDRSPNERVMGGIVEARTICTLNREKLVAEVAQSFGKNFGGRRDDLCLVPASHRGLKALKNKRAQTKPELALLLCLRGKVNVLTN